jgi:tetratricopeptide (TPR) repeat protein
LPKPNLCAHFNLGVQYEKKKMNKEAIYQFKQCLSLDQQHFGAAIHLAT